MKEKSSSSFLRISAMVLVSFSTASHLFTQMTQPFPASWAMPATFESCSVKPTWASMRIRHTSARSTAISARRLL